jgi:alpha-amylase
MSWRESAWRRLAVYRELWGESEWERATNLTHAMIPICLYFQVHQPYRLRRYNYFDVGREHRYFDEALNAELLRRAARKCYRPATEMLARLLERHPGFAVALSLSGCLLEQLAEWDPDTSRCFVTWTNAGERVEILAETSHPLSAWLASRDEFAAQIDAHRALVEALGLPQRRSRVFRNTEPIYLTSPAVSSARDELIRGVRSLLDADASHPHHLYRAATPAGLPLLLRDARLSDDIAFRFSQRSWSEWPLTAEKYDRWVSGLFGEILSLFMDFETFGEHQWRETGIFEFFEEWVDRASARGGTFWTPSRRSRTFRRDTSGVYDLWWTRRATRPAGNDLRRMRCGGASRSRAGCGPRGRVGAPGSDELRRDFRRSRPPTTCYAPGGTGCGHGMSSADAEVHAYFSPYESPYEAYIAYVHVLSDLERRLPRRGRTAAEAAGSRRPAAPMPA